MALAPTTFDRLPKAAKEELMRLQRQNARLLDDLQVALGQAPPGADTFVREGGADRAERAIGRGVRVRFHGKKGWPIEVYVDSHGDVQVRGEWSLTIQPQSGNGVRVLSEAS